MKNLVLAFVVAFVFCTAAMASDIAISTQSGWWPQATADREMQDIADNVTDLSVEQFTANDQDALAAWVADHTGDGAADILILCGQFPDTIYAPGNTQADDSIAELFLDDGNVIINTGDYIFYVVNGAGTNAAEGLQTMMDIPATMWGDPGIPMTPTADGRQYTPSYQGATITRPWFLDQFQGTDWQAELILGQSADGANADPAIIVNTVTGGRIGTFFQVADVDTDLRGEVISEWINNWFLTNLASKSPLAGSPDPEDGALYTDTWVTLSWEAGDFAASHDVYLGENFDDVNDGAGDTFRANLTTPFYIAGFPGYAYPDGLAPGTTYYWRIDEVNDTNPDSLWKGRIWSFTVPPKKAYNPAPGNGNYFVSSENLILSWSAGFGAKLHTVYFGEDYDTVANATGGASQGVTNFNPVQLEPEKTYYWRVDEFDLATTHTGDVWSFKTAKVGGGVRGDYYNWSDPDFVGGAGNPGPVNAFSNLVLTRTDPRIDFTFTDSPDPSINTDMFSARWTGEVEAAFTETYTFYTRIDDGARLWIDGVLLVDSWIDQGTPEYKGQIDLVAGNKYSLVMEYYENGGGAVAELRWSSPSTPKDFVPQAALSPPVKASSPSPFNGAAGTKMTPILKWGAGDSAVSHEVYFGTDADTVANADKTSPEYKGTKVLGDESYDPGKLAWNTAYYWRVDEVNDLNPDSPWIGSLWSFTTGDFLVIDDFEGYDAGENQIWYSWIDGLGFGAQGTDPYNPGNGTGAAVGDETTPSYTEETIVHGGRQSMPLAYDNNKQGYAKYSEAELTLIAPRDWTEEGVTELSLWFYGDPNNSNDPLYVAVSNSAGTPAVVVHDDPAAATINTWNEWVIPLQAFADQGITLSNVDKIAIGFGTRGNITVPGGSGKMIFDDIRLYRPREAAQE
ncbi:MAG TPA: hypothetical protein DIU00_21635 [Phycisphaerales bacterium]|nr:hypothetical protein [Phycisphaerales bacterium]